MIADSMTTNAKRAFMETRLRLLFCLFLVSASALGPADRCGSGNGLKLSGRTTVPSLLTSHGVFRWRDATCAAFWLVQHDVGDV